MKTLHKTFFCASIIGLIYSCNSNNNHYGGNSAVMEESNKDDYYQMRGYGDSIPSDSIREAKRLDSIRISNSNHHNK